MVQAPQDLHEPAAVLSWLGLSCLAASPCLLLFQVLFDHCELVC